jgi:hypothetical protein
MMVFLQQLNNVIGFGQIIVKKLIV